MPSAMAIAFEIYFCLWLAVFRSLVTLENMNNAKPHDPRTKTSIIRGHMAAGDWRNAVRIAARLPRLDKHRAAILDAQGAYENPRFYAQIGRDAETLIEAGAALRERFGHNQESKTMTIEKTYSNASNARRAAKAAGLSEFDSIKLPTAPTKFDRPRSGPPWPPRPLRPPKSLRPPSPASSSTKGPGLGSIGLALPLA